MINLNPLQTGSVIPKETLEKALPFINGYSVCSYCLTGNLLEIKKPDISSLILELKEFMDADYVMPMHGARESFFAVFFALKKENKDKSNIVVIDSLSHYSLKIACERAELEFTEVENSGYPEYKINEEVYQNKIEEVKEKTGKLPLIACITYPDGNYGNFSDVKKIARICKDYSVPLLINGAYSVGRMQVKLNEIGADFLIASCHKSMASSGPLGLLAFSENFKDILLKKSQYYPNKFVEFLGCTVRGFPLITLMFSLPFVKERVKNWHKEVEKARWFSNELEKRFEFFQLGEKPHNHDLLYFETPILYEISKKHKSRGFFLYNELKKRDIFGILPGKTKKIKISTYQIPKEELEKVVLAFEEIIEKNRFLIS